MQYIPIRIRVQNQQERLERLKNEQYIPAMRMGDGSKHSPGASDRMGNATIRRMMYEKEHQESIDADNAELDYMREAINALPDYWEREVLTLRYIDGENGGAKQMKWRNVTMKLYHRDDESALQIVRRVHKSALKNLEEMTR